MTPRISEQDEFLLSQLVDDDLPVEQAAVLRRRLADEPALRECFETLCRVDRALKSRRADQPTVDLESFHVRLMQRVAESVPVSEQDELLIGKLLDGELSSVEQRAIEQRLQVEPGLRQCRDELVRLNSVLSERRLDQPSVDYDQFHKQVMDRIADEARPVRKPIRFPAWFRVAAPIAVAASIALVVLLQPTAVSVKLGPSSGGQQIASDTRQPSPAETPKLTPAENVPGSLSVVVAQNIPSHDDSLPLDIQVSRPNQAGLDSAGIQVSYAVNTQLADEVRDADSEQASRPSRKVFFTAVADSSSPGGVEGDLF